VNIFIESIAHQAAKNMLLEQQSNTSSKDLETSLQQATIESLREGNANPSLKSQPLFLYEGLQDSTNSQQDQDALVLDDQQQLQVKEALEKTGKKAIRAVMSCNDDHSARATISKNTRVLSCFNDQCLTPAVTIAKHKEQQQEQEQAKEATIIGLNNFPFYLIMRDKLSGVNYMCNDILLAALHSLKFLSIS